MTVTMPTMEELRVMGMAMRKMFPRMEPALSGTSPASRGSRERESRKLSTM